MPKLPGVNHLDAVRALQKAGFWISRQSKHIIMTDGTRILTIPRHNPVNAITMGNIVKDAGLSVEDFRKLDVIRCRRQLLLCLSQPARGSRDTAVCGPKPLAAVFHIEPGREAAWALLAENGSDVRA